MLEAYWLIAAMAVALVGCIVCIAFHRAPDGAQAEARHESSDHVHADSLLAHVVGSGHAWSQTADRHLPPSAARPVDCRSNPLRRLVHVQRQSGEPEVLASRSDHAAERRQAGKSLGSSHRRRLGRQRQDTADGLVRDATLRQRHRLRFDAVLSHFRDCARYRQGQVDLRHPLGSAGRDAAGSENPRRRLLAGGGTAARHAVPEDRLHRHHGRQAARGRRRQRQEMRRLCRWRRSRHQSVEHDQQQMAALDSAAADRLQGHAVHRLGGQGLGRGGSPSGHRVRRQRADRQAEMDCSTRCLRKSRKRPARRTSGPACRSTRSTASSTCRSLRRARTSSAAIARRSFRSQPPSPRSTRKPASCCGAARSSITTSGTTTPTRRPFWSTSTRTARPFRRWCSRARWDSSSCSTG